MCSAMLAAFAAASLDPPPQLNPAGPSSFAHASACSVGEGDGGRRFACPHGDVHEATDDHADRAVCTLLPCEHHPFGCNDRSAMPDSRTSDLPAQLSLDTSISISGHMRLFAFTSPSSLGRPDPGNRPAELYSRISKIHMVGAISSKQLGGRGAWVIVLSDAPQVPRFLLHSCFNFLCGLLESLILLLTTFFLCLGTAASFGPPRWFMEKSSRHQIRTLFLICLALLPGGHAAKQQSGQEAAALSVSNATAMAPRDDPQSWEELTRASASSRTIHLSADFEMGDYTKEIHFGGKVLVIWGNNATLDAQQKGQFFSSTVGTNDDDDHEPGKTSLELHDLVLQNGHAADGVSVTVLMYRNVSNFDNKILFLELSTIGASWTLQLGGRRHMHLSSIDHHIHSILHES